jgi:hypothetical protein
MKWFNSVLALALFSAPLAFGSTASSVRIGSYGKEDRAAKLLQAALFQHAKKLITKANYANLPGDVSYTLNASKLFLVTINDESETANFSENVSGGNSQALACHNVCYLNQQTNKAYSLVRLEPDIMSANYVGDTFATADIETGKSDGDLWVQVYLAALAQVDGAPNSPFKVKFRYPGEKYPREIVLEAAPWRLTFRNDASGPELRCAFKAEYSRPE